METFELKNIPRYTSIMFITDFEKVPANMP